MRRMEPGESVISFETANDENQSFVEILRGTTTVFASATSIITLNVGPNTSTSYTDTGLAADTYYYWGIPQNGSGVAGNASAMSTAVVT